MPHLPDPLSDNDLTAYNNLPAIPEDRPLGDILQGILLEEGSLGVYKTADTSRSSTTTLAADPELTLPTVPSGYLYKVDIGAFATLTADGIKVGLLGTCTFSDLKVQALIYDTSLQVSGRITAFNSGVSHGNAGTGDHFVRLLGAIRVTETGSISFAWSQASSNINPLILQKSSYMRLTPV